MEDDRRRWYRLVPERAQQEKTLAGGTPSRIASTARGDLPFPSGAGKGLNNTYLGAARAAKDAGKPELARDYYAKLLDLASEDSTRPALDEARAAIGDKTSG